MTFQIPYIGELPWVPERTIYVTRHGSHAYGTSLPESDIDLRGVVIPPREYLLGLNCLTEVEPFESYVQSPPEPDLVLYALRKFFILLTVANPNVLELLFTEPEDHLLVTPLGQRILDNRELFLSKQCRPAFSGYAREQMQRINTHYRWLKNPPKAEPTRKEFDLPERPEVPTNQLEAAQAAVQKQVDRWNWRKLEGVDPNTRLEIKAEFFERLMEITLWRFDTIEAHLYDAAANSLGFDTNFIHHLQKERKYNAAVNDWKSYQKWQRTRNPQRAELEAKFGYDTKHAMHLMRLFRMCKELLTDGVLRVRRPDAEELLEIRRGKYTYEEILEFSTTMDKELQELAEDSQLPLIPDREKIARLCDDIIASSWS